MDEPSRLQDLSSHVNSPHNFQSPVIPQGRSHKRKQKVQNMLVRLRTRLCILPRTNPIQVPEHLWKKLATFGDGLAFRLNGHSDLIETSMYFMERAQDSSLWTSAKDKTKADPSESATSLELHRLCLLPHCDYSLDLNSVTTPGKYLIEEHRQIIA